MTNMISNTKNNEYLTLCQTNSTTPVDVYQNIPAYSNGLSFGSVTPELYDYYNSQEYLDQSATVKIEQKKPEEEQEALVEEEHQQQQQQQQQQGDFKPTFYNPFEIKHRRRTSRAQFKVLERTFTENPKPNAAIRRWLAQKLSMTPRGVQVWFQNRRAKAKAQQAKGQQGIKIEVNDDDNEDEKDEVIVAHQHQQHQQQQQQQQQQQHYHGTTSTSSSFHTDMSSASSSPLSLMTEPLGSRPQRLSTSSYDISSNDPSPVTTPCGCSNPMPFATPMSRTVSYPPMYSDASTTADEEEDNFLLMTPITPYQVPFVDGQFMSDLDYANQFLYDQIMSPYPVFNHPLPTLQRKLNNTWQPKNNNWLLQQEETVYPNRMLPIMDEHRRYSHPHRNFQSSEITRRLSEPIFDPSDLNFDPSMNFRVL